VTAPDVEPDDDTFGALDGTPPAASHRLTRDELLDELDRQLSTVVNTAVEQLLTRTYPESSLLDTIVKATELRLDVLRERDQSNTPATEGSTTDG
jgi:hypothetical protein